MPVPVESRFGHFNISSVYPIVPDRMALLPSSRFKVDKSGRRLAEDAGPTGSTLLSAKSTRDRRPIKPGRAEASGRGPASPVGQLIAIDSWWDSHSLVATKKSAQAQLCGSGPALTLAGLCLDCGASLYLSREGSACVVEGAIMHVFRTLPSYSIPPRRCGLRAAARHDPGSLGPRRLARARAGGARGDKVAPGGSMAVRSLRLAASASRSSTVRWRSGASAAGSSGRTTGGEVGGTLDDGGGFQGEHGPVALWGIGGRQLERRLPAGQRPARSAESRAPSNRAVCSSADF
jgi:hypothetical protein